MLNRRQMFQLIILALAVGFAWLLGRNDAALYKQPIAQVVAVKNLSNQSVTDEQGNEDRNKEQELTLRFLNRSGQMKVTNQYYASQAMTEPYRKGDQVILSHQASGWQIVSLKRDALLAALTVAVLGLMLILVGRRTTSWIMLALLANSVLFAGAIFWDITFKNVNVVVLFCALALLLAVVSLLIVLRFNWQALITCLSTIVATALAMIIMWLALLITGHEGVHFETMSYVTQVPVAVFYAQAVIGVLGAVMDETADIVAGLFGLAREPGQRAFHEYWDAGRSVGKEILGTLINVLFMIFIAETLPMVILMLRNGNNWSYILDQVMNLGILQTVVSAIGIVLAVPVTSLLTALILRERGGVEQ
ncbi:YibE/F family protein [Eupransor demetentiae]|uniref:Uncharacterized membrane protein n=1 Tax=Eupransor demetentiae TaxID=3109584 RepID=A0ABM9N361_9LACO|nr:Uncharacterized membrane protein [Lactobacillaceae bacterium LMG 33000]